MTEENEDMQDKTKREKLEAAGQMIIGEIETIGGILTADPVTRAEGEYNLEAGTLHRESSEALEEAEGDGEQDAGGYEEETGRPE